MKITHIVRNFEIGGLETVVLRLAEMQVIKGHTVIVICIEKEEQTVLDYTGKGFEVIKIEKKSRVGALIRVMLELVTNRPDIINTHNFLSNVYGAYAGNFLRIPVSLTLHSGESQEPLELKRRSLFLPQHIICVSDSIQSLILTATNEKINPVAITVINNGIDPDAFTEEVSSDTRHEFAISSDEFLVGTVGRMQPVKNQKILIEALEILSRDFNNIRMMIVGGGPLRNELENLAVSRGVENKILFPGNRNDVNRLLSAMDVFVLPSLAEGSPISLIEAMSARLPVVASDVGAIPQIVDNGVNGFIVPPGDIDALVDRIVFLFEERERANEIGEKAYQTIRSKYSMEIMYSSYQKVYENINNNKSIS